MGFRDQDKSDVTIEVIDRHHIGRGAERKSFAELGNGSRRLGCLNVLAHHLFDGEIAHPADIGCAADRFAAQMETPGCEWLAGRARPPGALRKRAPRRAMGWHWRAAGAHKRTTEGRARLALGRRGGRLLYAEQRHALVAFGPPQSGKSAGLAIPALLEWDGPAVASSIKTDLLASTATRRRELGHGVRFRPVRARAVDAHTWSPLRRRATWDGALEVAWRLAAAGEVEQRGVEGGDFWAIAAEQRLAPLLYTAARTGAGWTASCGWAYGQGGRELDEALAARPARPRRTGARRRPRGLRRGPGVRGPGRPHPLVDRGDRPGAAAGIPLRARAALGRDRRRSPPDRLLDERATLYLIGDAKASKLLRPIFLALLSEVVDRAYERATLAGGSSELPLLLCLDEAGNVAPLPNLAEIASTAPSHNIQLVSIFHDLAQARTRYGRRPRPS